MRNETPDRVPVRFFYQEAAARCCGVDNQTVGCDYNAAFDVTRKTAEEMGNDAVMLNAIWSNYGVAKAASWRYLAVPGVDIGAESVNQFSEPAREEDEFLKFGEYDEFISDPTAFLFNKWLARATTRVRETGQKTDFDHNLALISGALAYGDYMNSFGPAAYKLKYDAGIVSANSGMIKAPFDIIADKFRGFANTCIDAVENRKKLLRACEALMPHILANALAGADPDGNVPVTIWAHRGCVPFISPEIFNEIFWPTLKPIFVEVIRAGHQILFYGEGNWEAHYDNLLELPAGGIIYHIDRGDLGTARKLKRKFALSGGLPYDALARGTRDEIRAEMKKLFGALKDGGGYILDASALMLSDIKPENIKTAVDYAMEHGVYSASHAGGGDRFETGPEDDETNIFTGKNQNETAAAGAFSEYIRRGAAPGARPPNVCRSWEAECAGYKNLSGDVGLVRANWEKADAAAYNYLWTTVLW